MRYLDPIEMGNNFCISSFKRRGVYKKAAFISKIKIEENDIMCQFITIRYFVNYKLKVEKCDLLSLSSNKFHFLLVSFLINAASEHLRMRCLFGGDVY